MATAARGKLLDVLKDFDTVMLFTRTAEGNVRGRPMAIAEVDRDGTLYLVTSIDSDKAAELIADARVALGMQSKTKYASLSGIAILNTERALIDRLWKERWRVWFPEGKSSPDLSVIEVHPVEGEHWDQSGFKGIKLAIEAAKAYVTRQRPESQGAAVNTRTRL